ncbi:MAG: iron ABC transporter permease [Candidatus Omnitrophica bacterium]|nr:iron ABC transporter permease [Candidatus Omnitrophota bacterium]
MKDSNFNKKIFLLVLLFTLSIFLSLNYGSVKLNLSELFLRENRIILYLRTMRILLGIISGAGLATSGVVLQAILKNPLAEPYLLGTSSGASLGAILGMVLGGTGLTLPLIAFLGAIFSIILVYQIAKENGHLPVYSLILAGVIVSIVLSGIIIFIVSIYADKVIHEAFWWLWGSLSNYNLKLIVLSSFIVIPSIFIIFVFYRDLDAISIGEEEATHLGIEVEKVKKILFILVSLITSSIVCISGIIGFVGLIIPHIIRFSFGPNHKRLIPLSAVSGAVFLVFSDMLARTLIPPLEIPIGVITAFLGTPVFIFLLKKRQKVT